LASLVLRLLIPIASQTIATRDTDNNNIPKNRGVIASVRAVCGKFGVCAELITDVIDRA
jgi:hypothetical protein